MGSDWPVKSGYRNVALPEGSIATKPEKPLDDEQMDVLAGQIEIKRFAARERIYARASRALSTGRTPVLKK